MRPFRRLLVISLISSTISLLSASSQAADIFVTNPMPVDADINDSTCTLREAIEAVNIVGPYHGCSAGNLNNDTIHLPAGTYTLTSDMISILNQLTIIGSGASRTTINGGRHNCFVLNQGATIRDLTITNCGGSAVMVPTNSGATIDSVAFVNNGSGGVGVEGGEIHNFGSVFLSNSWLTSITNPFSGIVRTESGSSMSISYSTISASKAEHAIIFNDGGELEPSSTNPAPVRT
jgi:CSLREA domain-containing protein